MKNEQQHVKMKAQLPSEVRLIRYVNEEEEIDTVAELPSRPGILTWAFRAVAFTIIGILWKQT